MRLVQIHNLDLWFLKLQVGDNQKWAAGIFFRSPQDSRDKPFTESRSRGQIAPKYPHHL